MVLHPALAVASLWQTLWPWDDSTHAENLQAFYSPELNAQDYFLSLHLQLDDARYIHEAEQSFNQNTWQSQLNLALNTHYGQFHLGVAQQQNTWHYRDAAANPQITSQNSLKNHQAWWFFAAKNLGLGYALAEDGQTFLPQLSLGLDQQRKIFYQQSERHFALPLAIGVSVEQDLQNSPITEKSQISSYDWQIPFNAHCLLEGAGLRWQEKSWQLHWSHQQSLFADAPAQCRGDYLRFHWQGQRLALDVSHQRQTLESSWLASLNGIAAQGGGGFAWQQEQKQMDLAWSAAQTWHLLLFEQTGAVQLFGRYNARAMAGYWSSLLVDDGQFTAQARVHQQGAGLGYETRNDQGWNWFNQLLFASLTPSSPWSHQLNAFPWGVLSRDAGDDSIKSLDLLWLNLTPSFRWRHWQWAFTYQQAIPLSIRTNHIDSANVDSAADDASSNLADLKWQRPPMSYFAVQVSAEF